MATTNPLRIGALRLPRLRSRPARKVSWRGAAVHSPIVRTVAVATVLGLILVAGLAHFSTDGGEQPAPLFAADTIEAWLRHMTVTRTILLDAQHLDVPEGL
jgi:hypothetical protein